MYTYANTAHDPGNLKASTFLCIIWMVCETSRQKAAELSSESEMTRSCCAANCSKSMKKKKGKDGWKVLSIWRGSGTSAKKRSRLWMQAIEREDWGVCVRQGSESLCILCHETLSPARTPQSTLYASKMSFCTNTGQADPRPAVPPPSYLPYMSPVLCSTVTVAVAFIK